MGVTTRDSVRVILRIKGFLGIMEITTKDSVGRIWRIPQRQRVELVVLHVYDNAAAV